MSRILVVTLGGTICSATKDNTVKLHAVPNMSFWDKIINKEELSFLTPVLYSSENADESSFRKGLSAIISSCKADRPDGILILHGTDSMAYFAQLAVRVLSYLNLPVIITGSKLPADNPHSDAAKNVRYALGFLGAAIEGGTGSTMFGVVYTDEIMGDQMFIPAGRIQNANFDGDFIKFPGKPSIRTLKEDEAFAYLSSPVKKILTIPAVPGFPYDSINIKDCDVILIESYHSGTASINGLPELISSASSSGIRCFLAPVHNSKRQYESTKKLIDSGAQPIYDMPFEGAWAETAIW